MKLRSLFIRLIVLWIPVLPPTPLIARQHPEALPNRTPAYVLVTREASRGTTVSRIHREFIMDGRDSGG